MLGGVRAPRRGRLTISLLALLLITSQSSAIFSQHPSGILSDENSRLSATNTTSPTEYRAEIISTIPHDDEAFTQGLLIYEGNFYESTGLYNNSTIRRVSMSGEVVQQVNLSGEQFGEGLAVVGGTLVQLTWKSGIAHLYNSTTLASAGNFSYSGEGWGLCNSESGLVMSNGSSQLSIRSSEDFSIIRHVNVTLNGTPLSQLNELECRGGQVFANVWYEDWLAIIDLETGVVTGRIDCSEIFPQPASGGVLNGIAYDDANDTFWLTGKKWPITHEVRFVEVPPADPDGSTGVDGAVGGEGPSQTGGSSHTLSAVEEILLVALSLLAAVATFVLFGNGFQSVTNSRWVHNPLADTEKRQGDT